MKTIKILLGIIAINLTLLTIIQTGIWPPKVQASETNHTNVNYGLVPLNEDGSINVEVVGSSDVIIAGWKNSPNFTEVNNLVYDGLPVRSGN